MKRMNRLARARGLATGLLCLMLAAPGLAAPTTTRFEPALDVQGTPLVLNGAGTRYRTILKVYDMALYLPRKVRTPADLLSLPGPKRLQFTALRELPGTDLGQRFLRGMAENSSNELMTKHALSSTRFIEIFSARSKLLPGESFAMDFMPGKGTTFYIQGQPQGEPVGDDEFFGMVLRIWVGDSPADRNLKEALLGAEAAP